MASQLTHDGTSDVATPRCEVCAAVLPRRHRRFCSPEHRFEWWDAAHPRINRGPAGPRQGTLKALILGYLADGEWHTEQQIADAIHAFAHSVGARLSELRRAGHPIESRCGPGQVRLYRWVVR